MTQPKRLIEVSLPLRLGCETHAVELNPVAHLIELCTLVYTVALNVRSRGGEGDVERTLEVCRRLVEDQDDMVVKAMSWALRELVVHDPDAVSQFLNEHDTVLAGRVKREVRNKLTTGLKNPRRKDGS